MKFEKLEVELDGEALAALDDLARELKAERDIVIAFAVVNLRNAMSGLAAMRDHYRHRR